MRILSGIIGVMLSLFSSFFVVNAIVELIYGSKKGTEPGVLAGLLVFFLGTGLVGIMMAKRSFMQKQAGQLPLSDFDKEQLILALAQKTDGRLTVSEVALHCHLSIAESKKTLDRMAAEGVAELKINDDGSFDYQFVGLEPQTEDPSARANANEQERFRTPPQRELN